MASFSCSSSSVMGVILLLFSVLLAPARSASDQMILAACKTVGGGSTYFDVTFCLEALGSAGGSGGYQDLAAVAVDLLATNATSTEAKIDRLLGCGGVEVKADDAALARCLRSCQSLGAPADCSIQTTARSSAAHINHLATYPAIRSQSPLSTTTAMASSSSKAFSDSLLSEQKKKIATIAACWQDDRRTSSSEVSVADALMEEAVNEQALRSLLVDAGVTLPI
ncbi:hypothetical protein TRIUR3_06731 [Triticum urartu]|uniref:Uncharacterized protein n=1 Tax=Triticum urartu TaxID=4572 RepID=M8AMC7_TRIUA|nr:hypothetical protein TRIUR3_06731 [Triticum urartu]